MGNGFAAQLENALPARKSVFVIVVRGHLGWSQLETHTDRGAAEFALSVMEFMEPENTFAIRTI
jgi:hypothetical protein